MSKHPLIAYLADLERGDRAILRRSLSSPPGEHIPSMRYVEWYAASTNATEHQRQATYLLAGLFAEVERGNDAGPKVFEQSQTLGHAAAALYIGNDRRPSLERRFIGVLDATWDQLPDRLRTFMTLLRSEGIAIDWTQLLHDLRGWSYRNRSVQLRWARDFFRATTAKADADATADTDSSTPSTTTTSTEDPS